MSGKDVPTQSKEYIAPVISITKPAQAHSFICLIHGIRITITASILSVQIKGKVYRIT